MKRVFFIAAALAATTALAHQGVKNPVVKARMDNMSAIKDHVGILGQMAKGATSFDADAARAAAAALAAEAVRSKELFAANEDDPKSEAKPEIWADYAIFTQKADGLIDAAEAAAEVTSHGELVTALKDISATCRDCHGAFRE